MRPTPPARAGGRKKHLNNYLRLGHQSTSSDHGAPYFGSDFCYGNDDGNDRYGQPVLNYLALNPRAFNLPQSAGYRQTQARN